MYSNEDRKEPIPIEMTLTQFTFRGFPLTRKLAFDTVLLPTSSILFFRKLSYTSIPFAGVRGTKLGGRSCTVRSFSACLAAESRGHHLGIFQSEWLEVLGVPGVC